MVILTTGTGLPIVFKTVSEFRRQRAKQSEASSHHARSDLRSSLHALASAPAPGVEKQCEQAIATALQYFDEQAGTNSLDNTEKHNYEFGELQQSSSLNDNQESSGVRSTIEKDSQGRVTRALFCGADSVRFVYSEDDQLVEFNYAGMQWSREDEVWTAKDRQTEYFVEGEITVLPTGSIQIARNDVVRVLKTSGTRIDQHKSGSHTESRKLKNKTSPYDLLAKAKPVNSVWLTSRSVPRLNLAQSVQSADLNSTDENQQVTNRCNAVPMIPPEAIARSEKPAVIFQPDDSCFDSKLQSNPQPYVNEQNLRDMESSLLEQKSPPGAPPLIKKRSLEYLLKCKLWAADRVFGQSSPRHLEQLDKLADLYFEQNKLDLAELTHMRALHLREQFFGKGQPELAINIRGLARVCAARGNLNRADELFKKALELQESGLRKILFLYSEQVIGDARLKKELEPIFAGIAELAELYADNGRQSFCRVLYDKAEALIAEIIRQLPSSELTLNRSSSHHLRNIRQLSGLDLLT